MSDALNPYAPPTASVERRGQTGEVWRDGGLVAMEREGQLPPRCVRCNADAAPRRITRTLYWLPPLWRWSSLAGFVFLIAMMFSGSRIAAIALWPAVLLAAIANVFLRKKLAIEIPVCARHLRADALLTAGSVVAVLLFAGTLAWTIGEAQPGFFIGALALMFALGIVRARSGVRRIALARIDGPYAWLKGAGTAFRTSLPESAPGDRDR